MQETSDEEDVVDVKTEPIQHDLRGRVTCGDPPGMIAASIEEPSELVRDRSSGGDGAAFDGMVAV